jgi:glyoxylase-like metal-dependent hydrolase (beta-lactamase superfamily II)
MLITTFPVGPLQCNCSVIACPETKEAIIVDPGGDADKIMEFVKANNLTVKYLIHTHAHFDHILATGDIKNATGAKICLHEKDKFLYDNLQGQGMLFGFKAKKPTAIDHYLSDEEIIEIGKVKTKVLHTPGHTPGSLCFTVADKESTVFAGDTLFNGSIGRTDLPGGSFDTIIKSIKNRLFALDDSTEVVPGHGDSTNIWREKKYNPFVNG